MESARDKRPPFSSARGFPEPASAPHRFSWTNWKAIIIRTKNEIVADQIGIIAAATAYYAIFAIFPLLIALVSIYGLFADPLTVQQQIMAMSRFMPREAAGVISHQLHEILSQPRPQLGWGVGLSIFIAIWTASKGIKALMTAYNIAYDEEEKRSFFRLQGYALFLTFGAILTVLITIGLITVLPALFDFIGLKVWTEQILLFTRWPLLGILLLFGLALVNRFAPSREHPQWRWVTVGCTVAMVLILLASLGFSFYADRFAQYNKTYGSLAGIIVLLTWLYIVSYSMLLGAELNAEIEHQTTVDSTDGPPAPMGERGAIKADTVPS